MSSTAAIEVDDLSKSYADETVLQEVSFAVESGEFCVVMGPSGSGKSTLLGCIAGLVEHDSGTVRLSGESAETVPVRSRDLGYVFQEFEDTLFPHMTVAENVAFGLEQQDADHDRAEVDSRIDEMLDLLAIPDTRDSLPTELSGGQQQRVELARQLVRQTDILLLDDPLADLDYKLQKRMELEMRDIHAEMNSSFLYVTHNQDQALKLADKLVVLNRGRVEQIGTPEAVYYRPASAFVGRFVGDSNPFVGAVTADDEAEGEVSVETGIGRMAATVQGGHPADDRRALAMVRPESVAFDSAAEGRDNVFTARLIDWTYMGEETEYAFEVDGLDYVLQAVSRGRPTVTEADLGTTVPVGWDRADTLCFETVSSAPTVTVDDLMRV
jgi:ABC-type Fe3+/spermidine/putrescine transport system ATPase subunit